MWFRGTAQADETQRLATPESGLTGFPAGYSVAFANPSKSNHRQISDFDHVSTLDRDSLQSEKYWSTFKVERPNDLVNLERFESPEIAGQPASHARPIFPPVSRLLVPHPDRDIPSPIRSHSEANRKGHRSPAYRPDLTTTHPEPIDTDVNRRQLGTNSD